MRNPALPVPPEPKVSKRHPRAEWSMGEREAWVAGMLDAASLAQEKGDHALAQKISEAIASGPF